MINGKGRPKRGETQVPRRTLKSGDLSLPLVSCTLSEEVFARMEYFRAANYGVARATIMQKAIEQFLDREAPLKAKATQ